MSRLLSKSQQKRASLFVTAVWFLSFASCGVQSRLDEDHAIGRMMNIREAETDLKSMNGHYGTLQELADAKLMVPNRIEHGYQFTIRPSLESYIAVAVPLRLKAASASLYLDQTRIIRGMYRDGEEANANDEPLKEARLTPDPAEKDGTVR
jgi:hypothetical protein